MPRGRVGDTRITRACCRRQSALRHGAW